MFFFQVADLSEKKFLGNSLEAYLYFLITFIGGIILSKIVHAILSKIFTKISSKTKFEIDDIVWETINKPLLWLFYFGSLYFAIKLLEFGDKMNIFINKSYVIITTLIATIFVYKLWERLCNSYFDSISQKSDSNINTQLRPLVQKAGKFVVIVFAVITAVSNLGYNIFSLITGLGIGGVAVALAAQDTLSNLFSGVSIFIDKQFEIGDLVEINGQTGTVEEIGVRASRIRTLEDEIITIPNNKITGNPIKNLSRRRRRKVVFKIGFVYSTKADDLSKAKNIIIDILNKNENVDKNDIYVYFTDFGAYSLDFTIIYWTKSVDYAVYLQTREAVNLSLKRELENAGLEFAFPTYTIETYSKSI